MKVRGNKVFKGGVGIKLYIYYIFKSIYKNVNVLIVYILTGI